MNPIKATKAEIDFAYQQDNKTIDSGYLMDKITSLDRLIRYRFDFWSDTDDSDTYHRYCQHLNT